MIIITRVPSCKLHDREIAHALPNQRRLRRFGECSSRLRHLLELNMMSLHASECRVAERFPRIFSFSRFFVFSFSRLLVFLSPRLLVFSLSGFLVFVFSFSRFLVFSSSYFSRFLVFTFSRF